MMSVPSPTVPTWIGIWAIRAAVVFLGLFVTTLILDFFGLGKLKNPFHDWAAFWQFVAIGGGISLLLGLEFLIERLGWIVPEPEKKPPSASPPMN